jgi:hypothetical protein
MAFTKVWNSTNSGDYASNANWKEISVRNAAYSWTASGSGTSEYYLRTAGGANPGFQAAPDAVLINAVEATSGTPGSLAAGRYGYGDNDSLGYSTLYVRLSDGTDPDTKALDYITFRQTPKANEHVRLPAGTASVSSNLDQSTVALGSFIVEDGYESPIASSAAYLRIQTARFEFSGTGTAYIDLTTSSNVAPQVLNTAAPNTGERGLYLLGSDIDVVNVVSGHVGIAVLGGESATVDTVRVLDPSATVWVGAGCALTNWEQFEGTSLIRCNGTVTSILVYGGDLKTEETVIVTTFTQKGGTVVPNSTGDITTYNIHGGVLDLRQSGAEREIGTLNKHYGSYSIRRNKEAVTIVTETYNDTVDEAVTPVS